MLAMPQVVVIPGEPANLLSRIRKFLWLQGPRVSGRRIVITVLTLTIITYFLVIECAGEEPFLRVRIRHLVTQVLLPMVSIAVWSTTIWTIIRNVLRKRLRKAFIVLAVWGIVALSLTAQVLYIYISDIIMFRMD